MPRTRFKRNDGTVERARQLRQQATPAEQAFWQAVRSSALSGYKFRRQQRLGPFTADFVCQSARLVVELDGDTHVASAAADERRTLFLNREGYRVLRFTNADVLTNLDGVLTQIDAILAKPSPSHSAPPSGPLPLPRRGEGL